MDILASKAVFKLYTEELRRIFLTLHKLSVQSSRFVRFEKPLEFIERRVVFKLSVNHIKFY